MAIALRKTESRDLEVIHRMLCALEETDLPFAAFRNIFLRNINDAGMLYLVACHETGEIVGHLALHTQWLLHHAGLVAEIQEMFVDPSYRGAGIGENLLKEALKWADEKGCVLVEVTANINRTRTHGFYSANGFDKTHLKFTMPLTTS